MQLNKDLYIEVSSVWELNAKVKEGYELVAPVIRTQKETESPYADLSGQFMNNPISLRGSMGGGTVAVPYTCYLMKLTPQGELLYGKE